MLKRVCRISRLAVQEKRASGLVRDERLRRLVQRAHAVLDDCARTELCNTLNGISKLRYHPGKAFLDQSRDRAMLIMDTFVSQSFSNVINAYARLKYDPGPAFRERFIEESRKHLPSFRTMEFAGLLNGYGWLGLRPPDDYMQQLTSIIYKGLAEYRPQEIANVVNGFVKMGNFHPGDDFLQALAQDATPKLDKFANQDLCCVINAFGHFRFQPSEAFLRAFTPTVVKRMPSFNGQDFGNVINAYAKLDLDPSKYDASFFPSYCRYSVDKLSYDFNPQELSLVINGLAKFAPSMHMPDSYLDAFTQATLSQGRLKPFIPQALSVMLHAYGRFTYCPCEPFLRQVLAFISDHVGDFTTQGLAISVNGLAKMRYHPGSAFVETIMAAAMTKSEHIDWQNMSNLLNACVVFKHTPRPEFWEELHDVVARQADGTGIFEVASALYCFAALDGPGPDTTLPLLLERACVLIEQVLREDPTQHEMVDQETGGAYRQLYQTYRYLYLLHNNKGVKAPLRERFGVLTKRLWEFIAPRIKTAVITSPFQVEVEEHGLKPLGLVYETEVLDGPFTLDFVVRGVAPGVLPVVIEVDGPSHFFVNRESEPTGTSEFKYRLLEAHRVNWQGVLQITAADWSSKTAGMRAELMVRKFTEAGVDIRNYMRDGAVLATIKDGSGRGGQERRAMPRKEESTQDRRHHMPAVRKPHADLLVVEAKVPSHAKPPFATDEVTEEMLSGLLVPDLKALCRVAGLKVSGRKSELVTRLLSAESSEWVVALRDSARSSKPSPKK